MSKNHTLRFIVQTLYPIQDTEGYMPISICLFPNVISEMSGHESIWAQSYIYDAATKIRKRL